MMGVEHPSHRVPDEVAISMRQLDEAEAVRRDQQLFQWGFGQNGPVPVLSCWVRPTRVKRSSLRRMGTGQYAQV